MSRTVNFVTGWVLALSIAGVVAAGTDGVWAEPGRGPSGASLHERLGGTAAIAAVVDQFVANVGKDTRINGRFATTDLVRLKQHLVDQICQAAGGPCVYKGRDMKTAHAGMRITTADFDALVEDLVAALNQFRVPAKDQQELLSLLSSMRKEIVEVP